MPEPGDRVELGPLTPMSPRSRRSSLLVVVELVVIGAALGVIAGFVWLRVAPRPMLEVRDDGVYYLEGQQQVIIGQDGWFIVIMVATGLLIGLVAYLRWRRSGPAFVIGAALGAGVAGVVAWRLGVWLGRSEFASIVGSIADGTRSLGSLKLRAYGALFVAPIAATLVTLTGSLSRGTDLDPHPDPHPDPQLDPHPDPNPAMKVPQDALEAVDPPQQPE